MSFDEILFDLKTQKERLEREATDLRERLRSLEEQRLELRRLEREIKVIGRAIAAFSQSSSKNGSSAAKKLVAPIKEILKDAQRPLPLEDIKTLLGKKDLRPQVRTIEHALAITGAAQSEDGFSLARSLSIPPLPIKGDRP